MLTAVSVGVPPSSLSEHRKEGGNQRNEGIQRDSLTYANWVLTHNALINENHTCSKVALPLFLQSRLSELENRQLPTTVFLSSLVQSKKIN